ncbi:MAG: F0F1 ATP synthase subunit epsilon [Planctomycetota bacterium]
MATLTLRVITPEAIALDEAVQSVQLPTLDGSCGVLPRHAHMITGIDTGVLVYRRRPGKQVPLFRTRLRRGPGQHGARHAPVKRPRRSTRRARPRPRSAHTRAPHQVRRRGQLSDVDVLRGRRPLQRAIMRLRTSLPRMKDCAAWCRTHTCGEPERSTSALPSR